MAGWGGAAALRQQPEAIVQARGELVERQGRHPRRRQLDRQRDAIEPLADLGDRRGILCGQVETRQHRCGPIDEELDRRVVCHPDHAGRLLGRRHGERSDRPDVLAIDSQQFAARRQDADLRAIAQQGIEQAGAGIEQMLAVVHDQEQPPVAQRRQQRFVRRLPRPLRQAEGARDPLRDERAVA